jgi:hypothetical protein
MHPHPQQNHISDELIKKALANIDPNSIEKVMDAAPVYGNGMSDNVRKLLSDKDKVRLEVSNTLTVFAF